MRIRNQQPSSFCTRRIAAFSISAMVPILTVLPAFAADFAPAGTKATLSVEYIYESAGKRSSEGMYDPYQWQVKRTVNITADLVSKAPAPNGGLKPPDAEEIAQLKGKAEKTKAISKKLAPTITSMEQISEKCGDNENCLMAEAMKLNAGMQANGQMDTLAKTRGDIDELSKPGAIRYQNWIAAGQKGSYSIKEVVHVSVTDPICTSHPRHRCTRDEIRVGNGDLPAPPDAKKRPQGVTDSFAEAEVDSAKNTLTLRLPLPLTVLDYIETITTDEPEGTHSVPTPKGPHKMQMVFRTEEKEFTGDSVKVVTVPLKGGWRSQSGEYTQNIEGEFGNGGKLKVLWRFKVQ